MEIVDGVFQLRIYLELISSILPQTITIHLVQIVLPYIAYMLPHLWNGCKLHKNLFRS